MSTSILIDLYVELMAVPRSDRDDHWAAELCAVDAMFANAR